MKEQLTINQETAKAIALGILVVGVLFGTSEIVSIARAERQRELDNITALCGEDYQACFVTTDLGTNTELQKFCNENPDDCAEKSEAAGNGNYAFGYTEYYIRIPSDSK